MKPFGEVLDDPVSEERIGQLWTGTEKKLARGERRSAALRRGALALLLCGFGVGGGLYAAGLGADSSAVYASAKASSALQLRDGQSPTTIAATAGPMDLEFGEGSRIDLRRGRLRPIENDADRFVVELDGEAFFEVVPGGARRWIVRSGPLTVEVLGTAFGVAERDGGHEVWVSHGVVRVTEADGTEQVLTAGDRIEVGMAERVEAIDTGDTVERQDEAVERVTTPPSAPGPSWRELARAGSHGEAYDTLGDEGLADQSRRATPQELLLLADVARLSGHPADAVEPLERLLHDHAGDSRAAVAAVTLGRLEMDVLHRPDRARRALERARMLGVPSVLASDVDRRLAALEPPPTISEDAP